MSDIAIRVTNLSKVYPLYHSNRHRLLEAVHPLRKKYHTDFYALKDVSFEIKKGESVGIIGQNGSGKSTLLKIITGVLTPTSGSVEVNGRISSLLELGTGFNPEMTGIENVFFYGTINGISHEEMERRLDSILSFADIGDFVYQPVKTYSSGMFVRLAFACAINVDPEILIIDEALAVGDVLFQAKCMAHLKKLRENHLTLLFVSHDIHAIKGLCEKALWLNLGHNQGWGLAGTIAENYYQHLVKLNSQISPTDIEISTNWRRRLELGIDINAFEQAMKGNDVFSKISNTQKSGDSSLILLNVNMLDESGELVKSVNFEDQLTINCLIKSISFDGPFHVAYHIRDKNNYDLVYSDTLIERLHPISISKGEIFSVSFSFSCRLKEGMYVLAVMVSYSPDTDVSRIHFADFRPMSYVFEVSARKPFPIFGALYWENQATARKILLT